jgi:hypothetical protein
MTPRRPPEPPNLSDTGRELLAVAEGRAAEAEQAVENLRERLQGRAKMEAEQTPEEERTGRSMTPPPRHTDYSGRTTDEREDGTPTPARGIAPETPVAMSLRTFIAMISGIVVFLVGIGGTYWALASTDKDLASKQSSMQQQLSVSATKQDLEILRLNVKADLLSAVWHCESGGNGTMQCRPVLDKGR